MASGILPTANILARLCAANRAPPGAEGKWNCTSSISTWCMSSDLSMPCDANAFNFAGGRAWLLRISRAIASLSSSVVPAFKRSLTDCRDMAAYCGLPGLPPCVLPLVSFEPSCFDVPTLPPALSFVCLPLLGPLGRNSPSPLMKTCWPLSSRVTQRPLP
jgi:hypothetical protein